MTNLWSRRWVTDEQDDEPDLGECFDTRHRYSSGIPYIDDYPRATLIGSAECIANGEAAAPDPGRNFEGGWDERCFFADPAPPLPAVDLDVRHCETQQRMALLSNLLYTPGGQPAADKLFEWWPFARVQLVPNNDSAFPGTLIASMNTTTLVVISGTTNPLQWIMQVFYGVQELAEQQGYATSQLWNDAADRVQARIDMILGAFDGPIVFVGHSYGGAVACILAARYCRNVPGRRVQLLTFGCPKPGDQRLIDLLGTSIQQHLVDDNDVITYLPPSGVEFMLINFAVPAPLALKWRDWQRPRFRIGLRADRTRYDNPQPEALYELLFRLVLTLPLGVPPDIFSAHFITEYQRRIICPGQPAPTPQPQVTPRIWLAPESLIGLADGDVVERWPDLSGWDNDAIWQGNAPQPDFKTFVVNDLPAVRFEQGGSLLFDPNVPFGNTFSAYIVATTPAPIINEGCGPQLLIHAAGGKGAPRARTSSMRFEDTVSTLTLATGLTPGNAAVWIVRRGGSNITLETLDDASVSTVIDFDGLVTLDGVCASTQITVLHRLVLISEVIVFNDEVGTDEHEAIITYLRLKYRLGIG